eukprot:jgi/Hompol1/390/HPOL_002972-RA
MHFVSVLLVIMCGIGLCTLGFNFLLDNTGRIFFPKDVLIAYWHQTMLASGTIILTLLVIPVFSLVSLFAFKRNIKPDVDSETASECSDDVDSRKNDGNDAESSQITVLGEADPCHFDPVIATVHIKS